MRKSIRRNPNARIKALKPAYSAGRKVGSVMMGRHGGWHEGEEWFYAIDTSLHTNDGYDLIKLSRPENLFVHRILILMREMKLSNLSIYPHDNTLLVSLSGNSPSILLNREDLFHLIDVGLSQLRIEMSGNELLVNIYMERQ
jgi:hypothetical protein